MDSSCEGNGFHSSGLSKAIHRHIFTDLGTGEISGNALF